MTAGGLKPALMRLAFSKFTAARAEPLEAVEHHTSSSTGGEEDNSKVCTHTNSPKSALTSTQGSVSVFMDTPTFACHFHGIFKHETRIDLKSLLPRADKDREETCVLSKLTAKTQDG